MACLIFVYSSATAWDEVHAILCHIVFCWGLHSTDIFKESLCLAFDMGQIDCGEFPDIVLSLDLDFLEPMLYSPGSYCGEGCLLNSFLLIPITVTNGFCLMLWATNNSFLYIIWIVGVEV